MSVKNRTRATTKFSKITDEAILREAREKLIIARTTLLMREEFFGTVAMMLLLQEASEWCPTAATDGKFLYYNAEFVNSLDNSELQFLVCHEILHCVYDHLGRCGKRDSQLWNIAIDLLVNSVLVECKIGKMINSGFIDPRYTISRWTSEEVYEDLLKRKKSGENVETLYGEGFDVHLPGEEESKNRNKNNSDKNSENEGKDEMPVISKEMAEQVSNIFKAAVISAAQNAQKSAGNIPLGIKITVDSLIEPKIDWREILFRNMASLLKTDYHPLKLNRRSFVLGYPIRAMTNGEVAKAAIFIDTSGSCVNEVRYFLSEVKNIASQFSEVDILIGCFDTKVYNVENFNIFNLHELEDYQTKGGGGTDFNAMFDYMKEKQIVPELLVVFTDGMPYDSWGDENYCNNVLWIIYNNPAAKAPFGQQVAYEHFS